jgi:adenylate kinase
MNILFIGKPGSGKGTITQNLIDDGFLQLSTGDLLREEEERGTPLGIEIGKLLAQGKFATDETIFKLVGEFLDRNKDKSIIFDGFPRNSIQAQSCVDNGIIFNHIFLIEVSDEKVKERIVNRWIHKASGRVYNLKTMPPKVNGLDDITNEPLIQRQDDKLEILDKRLVNYRELTEPVLKVLKDNAMTINVIDGEDDLSNQINKVKNILLLKNKKNKLS